MSRRDELVAVIGEHRWRSDGRCTCGWRPDRTIPQFPDPPRVPTIVQFEQHQADAVLAWLGEQLGDEGLLREMRAAADSAVPWQSRWQHTADAALVAVWEWFGVTE